MFFYNAVEHYVHLHMKKREYNRGLSNGAGMFIIFVAICIAVFYLYSVTSPATPDKMNDEGEVDTEMMEDESASMDTEVSSENQEAVTASPASVPPSASTIEVDVNGFVLIHYTKDGFSPNFVPMNRGGVVRFINESDRPLRLYPDAPAVDRDTFYNGFDEGKSIPRGESFIVSLTRAGTFPYKNLNHEIHTGTVTVNE